MTRETKIGLLVGLAIILLIGIIISEHLSATGDATSPDDQGAVVAEREGNDSIPALRRQEPSGDGDEADEAGQQGSPSVPPPEREQAPRQDRTAGRDADRHWQQRIAQLQNELSTLEREKRRWRQQAERWQIAAERGDSRDRDRSLPPPSQDRGGDGQGGDRDGGQAEQRGGDQGGGRITEHTVESGERLWDLAVRYYGDGSKWRRIKDANPDVVTGEASIRAGDTLRIPDADNGTGGDQGSARTQSTRGDERSGQGGSMRTYRVQANDNLWKIAERELGDGTRWRELLELNEDVLDDPTRLPVGRQIRVPR